MQKDAIERIPAVREYGHSDIGHHTAIDVSRRSELSTRKEGLRMRTLVGLAMTMIVAAASLLSFSPRTMPVFPATHLFPDRLLVNGVSMAGARIVAVAELGHILLSDDQGASWTEAKVSPNRGATFTQVQFVDKNLGFAVGHDDVIVRTQDGGRSWNEVHFDGTNSETLLGISLVDSGRLLAFGGFGHVLVSNDRGETWSKQSTGLGEGHIYGIAGDGHSKLLLVGEQGLVARSIDRGMSWERLPEFYKGSFFGLLKVNDTEFIAYGMRGNVWRTRDFGSTWEQLNTGVELALFGGTVTSDGRVVLVGQGGVVLASDGNGQFKTLHPGGGQSLSAVAEGPDRRLLVAGESGVRLDAIGTSAEKK